MGISKKALFTSVILAGSGCVLIWYVSLSRDGPESALTKAAYILQNEAKVRWYQFHLCPIESGGETEQATVSAELRRMPRTGWRQWPGRQPCRCETVAGDRRRGADSDHSRRHTGSNTPAIMLDSRAAWQIAAHVRRLGRAPKMPAGDSALGKQLFETKGHCLECHTVGLRGGTTGPDLSAIGSKRGAAALRKAILDRAAYASEAYQLIEIIPRSGQRVTGFRANEDTFSIQVRELSGRVRSFLKDEVGDVRIDRTKSLMPRYQNVFTQSETDNVVAYLASLRGRQ